MLKTVAGLLTGRVSDASYAAGWAAVRALPEGAAGRLFDAGADLAARRGGKGVDRLRSNLARVAPGQELTRAALRSYARYWREVFRLQVTPAERIVAGTETIGEPAIRDLLASGRGVVFALPHSGNWDMAGAWFGATGVRFTTVAERLKPESLYDRFVEFRESLGMEVLPLTGGERPPFDVLTERLAAGGAVCLMADRDLTPRGIDVDFFGATARMPAGPASLVLKTGAALVPVHLSFTDRGWRIQFFPEVPSSDVPTMTQAMARDFEYGIRRYPADWHMLQRLWLDDLEPRR
ncbi:MAG: phosphatidylinositol mannoside acyltransferase [Actinobacteria bacterium]|nr:phosphatidylinositol mannoside acyltransferase [Actinomycetota bacterium]